MGPPFLLGGCGVLRSIAWAEPMWPRQPTAIFTDLTVRSIEGEQYARVGLALLLHVQQNR
jgi:hypothetical protein